MAFKKEYIVVGLILLLVVGSVGAVFQFYVAPQLAQYQRDEQLRDALRGKTGQMSATFNNIKPALVVDAWEKVVPAWETALEQRRPLFEEFDTHVEVPEEQVDMLQFWYEKEFRQRILALQQYVTENQAWFKLTSFGAKAPSELKTGAVTTDQVEEWLRQLNMGSEIVRMLVDAKAFWITEVHVWPEVVKQELLVNQTTGVEFYMTLPNLVEFMQDLYNDDRYFEINGFKITNTELRRYTDPPIKVQMVLTMATMKDKEVAVDPGVTAALVAAQSGAVATDATPAVAAGAAVPAVSFGNSAGTDSDRVARLRAMNEAMEDRFAEKPWWRKLLSILPGL